MLEKQCIAEKIIYTITRLETPDIFYKTWVRHVNASDAVMSYTKYSSMQSNWWRKNWAYQDYL